MTTYRRCWECGTLTLNAEYCSDKCEQDADVRLAEGNQLVAQAEELANLDKLRLGQQGLIPVASAQNKNIGLPSMIKRSEIPQETIINNYDTDGNLKEE